MKKYFSNNNATSKTGNKQQSSNEMIITPKKVQLDKTQKNHPAGDVDVVIVKKKVGETNTTSDVSSMMEEMEKNDENGTGKKIDAFMKDALECESIEKS